MKSSLKITLTNLIGVSVAFYFATYLSQTGAIAAGPILISALIALIAVQLKIVPARSLSTNEKMWIYALLCFGSWSIFTIWLDNAETKFYEIPAKFIVGAIIAIPILKIGVDYRWIKLGVTISCLILGVLVAQSYEGGRFSPIMNATKWGNAVALQTMLTFIIATIEKNSLQRICFLIMGVGGIYVTVITGTRGAILPLIALLVILIILYTHKLSLKYLSIFIISISLSIITLSQLPIIKSRTYSTVEDFNNIQNDNYNNSIGIRLTMWHAGIQAFMESPIVGQGYDFKRIFTNYDAPSPGLKRSSDTIKIYFRLFHSTYIDILVTKGITGLVLFFFLLSAGLRSNNTRIMLIMLPPTLGIAAAGITDSTLSLGITSSYMILAGTFLKATRIQDEQMTREFI